jgi:hypothetical protein
MLYTVISVIRHWYHNVVGVDEAEGDLRTDEKGAALLRSNWFLRPTHQETRDVLPAPILVLSRETLSLLYQH